MMSFVEGHRVIFHARGSGPMGQYSALHKISDLDLLPVWNIDENTSPRFFELKGFGMSIDGDLPGFLSRGIQKRECPISFPALHFAQPELFSAVANEHPLAAGVEKFRLGKV